MRVHMKRLVVLLSGGLAMTCFLLLLPNQLDEKDHYETHIKGEVKRPLGFLSRKLRKKSESNERYPAKQEPYQPKDSEGAFIPNLTGRTVDKELIKSLNNYLKHWQGIDARKLECTHNETIGQYWVRRHREEWPVQDSWDKFYSEIGSCDMYRPDASPVVRQLLHDMATLPVKHVVLLQTSTAPAVLLTGSLWNSFWFPRRLASGRLFHSLMANLEDTWAFVPIGHPFPDNPYRVKGETNQFVALWYKHGKPTCGRAWNNGGVLECSFPYNGKELSGQRDLGGQIQVLTFTGNYATRGFLYNWVPYKNKDEPHYQLVRCGDVTPAFMRHSSGQYLMGEINMKMGMANVSFGGKAESCAGNTIQDMLVVVRNLKEPPKAPPPIKHCPHEEGQCPPLGEESWVDLRVKEHKFPLCAVIALGRPLKMEDGSTQKQAVALWYKNGEPVMGRAYDAGNLAAAFGWGGKEFSGDIGSVQVKCYHHKEEQRFELSWRPYKDCRNEGWGPVRVKDTVPCVIVTPAGGERLGQYSPSQGRATVAWGGKEEVYTGPEVQNFMVLCRNPPL